MTISDYKSEFRLLHGDHDWDAFYGAFDLMFAISAELSYRNNDYPFDNWQYREPLSTDYREPDNYWFSLLADEDVDTLITLGNLFHRYINYLEHKGYEV